MKPTTFATFVHPKKAYRLEYPAHWEHLAEDDARSCGFGPRDRNDVGIWISIMPVSLDTSRITDDLTDLFTKALSHSEAANIREVSTLRHFALQADMTAAGQGGQYWMLAGGDLVLFASSTVPPAERDVWGPQFDRLLASLRITRDEELRMRKVANEVLRRLQDAHPDQEYEFDERGIVGNNHVISLQNVLLQIRTAPDDEHERIIQQFVDGLTMTTERPLGYEVFADVRDQILPVLKPIEYIRADTPTSRLVYTEWLDDVVICYVIRGEKTFRFLTDWDLGRWNLEHEALHRLAIENLSTLEWPEVLEGSRHAGGRVIIVSTEDNFDASRLLHPDLHKLFSGPLGSPFYVGVPDRDTLVTFSGKSRVLTRRIVRQLKKDFEKSAYPITPRAFLVTADGIAPAELK